MTNKFVIIAKDNCPYCIKAKELLDRLGEQYLVLDVMEYPVLRNFLKTQGLNTVPQVYQKGQLIGGYEDLAERFRPQLEMFEIKDPI